MKKNKLTISSLFFFIIAMQFPVMSQKSLSSLLSNAESNSYSISLAAMDVLDLAPDQIDSILFYAEKSQSFENEAFHNQFRRSTAFYTLGFLASDKNNQVVHFLDSIANSNDLDHSFASEAIFRIGGDAMDKHLTYIFSKDNFRLQLKTIENLWVIDNLKDCAILEKHLVNVKEKHPDWKINNFIDVTFRRHLDFAIGVQNEEDQQIIFDKLTSIVTPSFNGPFHAIPGDITYLWALKMLNKYVDNKDQLYEFAENRKAKLANTPIKEAFLFYLDQWGYKLTSTEVEWLNHVGFLLKNKTIIFRSKEEILQYHDFRKKYPSKHNHTCY